MLPPGLRPGLEAQSLLRSSVSCALGVGNDWSRQRCAKGQFPSARVLGM